MVDQIAQLLGIIGFDAPQPQTMAELIPYLLHAGIAVGLLVALIKMFKSIIALLMGHPRI